jgi:hypothetical protein
LHQGSLKQTLFTDMQGVPKALTEARALRASMSEPEGTEVVSQPQVSEELPPMAPRPEVDPDSVAEAAADFDPTAQLDLF